MRFMSVSMETEKLTDFLTICELKLYCCLILPARVSCWYWESDLQNNQIPGLLPPVWLDSTDKWYTGQHKHSRDTWYCTIQPQFIFWSCSRQCPPRPWWWALCPMSRPSRTHSTLLFLPPLWVPTTSPCPPWTSSTTSWTRSWGTSPSLWTSSTSRRTMRLSFLILSSTTMTSVSMITGVLGGIERQEDTSPGMVYLPSFLQKMSQTAEKINWGTDWNGWHSRGNCPLNNLAPETTWRPEKARDSPDQRRNSICRKWGVTMSRATGEHEENQNAFPINKWYPATLSWE